MYAGLLLLPLLLQDAPADRFQPVREHLSDAVENGAYRNVVAAVEVNGERVFTHTEGEFEEDALFRIFSMTKPVTAVGALILIEEGHLELETPLGEVLPEFAEMTVLVDGEEVPAERPIRMLDLFRHTSGLTYGLFSDSPVDRLVNATDLYTGDLARFSEQLAALPLKHQPGTRFEYSLSSDVLGRVIEVVSEQRLDAFLEARIFGPLGMEDTGFHVEEEDMERLPPIHGRTAEGLVEQNPHDLPPPNMEPPLHLGGAGLFSTTEDYLRFCRMLLGGGALGEVRILKEATVDAMLSDQLGDLRGGGLMLQGSAFGLGLAVTRRSPRSSNWSKGSAWWGGAAGTGFWVDREQGVIGVFMIQNWMELGHVSRFRSEIYRALAR